MNAYVLLFAIWSAVIIFQIALYVVMSSAIAWGVDKYYAYRESLD